jgi:hypothetical protein
MRHGKNNMISSKVSKALVMLTRAGSLSISHVDFTLGWRTLYTIFTTLKLQIFSTTPKLHYLSKIRYFDYTDLYKQQFSSQVKKSYQLNLYSNLISNLLKRYLPLFSFFIKKVSKLKWKHSRGRSGRYSIIWKYVPTYRRLTILLRWLVTDIQFQKDHSLLLRIHNSIKNILISPFSHVTVQFRMFVHRYVFQRCKNTLLSKLTTDV